MLHRRNVAKRLDGFTCHLTLDWFCYGIGPPLPQNAHVGTAETTVFERCCCCFVNVVALVELCQCGDLNVTLESRGRLTFAFDCAKTAQNASSWYFMIGATLGHSFTTLELRRMIGCAKLRVLRWEIELFAFKIQIWPDAVQWRKQEKAVQKASSIYGPQQDNNYAEVKCWLGLRMQMSAGNSTPQGKTRSETAQRRAE